MKRNLEIVPLYNTRCDAKYFHKLDKILANEFGAVDTRNCDNPTDALIRGILSQNTNDRNRDRAFSALKSKIPDWNDVLDTDDEIILKLIRPAGMAYQRCARIKGLLRWLAENNNGEIDAKFLLDLKPQKALDKLIDVDGIGIKTAAVFLLFCGDAPFFPVDTHIKRIMVRLGVFAPKTPAEKMIPILSDIVPPKLHKRFHLNLLKLGRQICGARNPKCDICPFKNSKICKKIGIDTK